MFNHDVQKELLKNFCGIFVYNDDHDWPRLGKENKPDVSRMH